MKKRLINLDKVQDDRDNKFFWEKVYHVQISKTLSKFSELAKDFRIIKSSQKSFQIDVELN